MVFQSADSAVDVLRLGLPPRALDRTQPVHHAFFLILSIDRPVGGVFVPARGTSASVDHLVTLLGLGLLAVLHLQVSLLLRLVARRLARAGDFRCGLVGVLVWALVLAVLVGGVK